MKISGQSLTKVDLTALAAPNGLQYRVHTQDASQQIVAADMGTDEMLSGLRTHYFDGRELIETKFDITLNSSLIFGVLLEGRLDFSIDGIAMQLQAGKESNPEFFVLNLTQKAMLCRTLNKDNRVRKFNISVDRSILDKWLTHKNLNSTALSKAVAQHGGYFTWTGTKEDKKHANKILTNLKLNLYLLDAINLESELYRLISKCLGNIVNQPTFQKKEILNVPTISTRALRIQHHLNTQINSLAAGEQDPTIKNLAQALNISASSLQRTFRESFGESVMVYIRNRRLEKARNAILRQNVSLGEAAFIAGYNHTSNFSIAFKRFFGVTPGALKSATKNVKVDKIN